MKNDLVLAMGQMCPVYIPSWHNQFPTVFNINIRPVLHCSWVEVFLCVCVYIRIIKQCHQCYRNPFDIYLLWRMYRYLCWKKNTRCRFVLCSKTLKDFMKSKSLHFLDVNRNQSQMLSITANKLNYTLIFNLKTKVFTSVCIERIYTLN